MIEFARPYHAIDSTTKTNRKVATMVDYFRSAPPADAAWAAYVLSGRKLRQLVPTKRLRVWAAERAGIPARPFDESYQVLGDLAETMSLLVPPPDASTGAGAPQASGTPESLATWVETRLLPLRRLDEAAQREAVVALWNETPAEVRFPTMKWITGVLRVGVSGRLVTRAIAIASGLPPEVIAHRMTGDFEPAAETYRRLVRPDTGDTAASQPYPFCLAHPVAEDPADWGDSDDFLAEWKWDGIRAQGIRREGQTFVWSRGEELMMGRWPEIEAAAEALPDGTVLDGEILAIDARGRVRPFGDLQRRIGRKRVGPKLLRDVPVRFLAFDLLEVGGVDRRALPLAQRRTSLERLFGPMPGANLGVTELLAPGGWDDWAAARETARGRMAEGLMIKRKDAPYGVGRTRGIWWKWKLPPHTVDAVLIYARRGHGKRANLYTDYTFAVWDGDRLVPFANAYSGLNDREIREVDRFVRGNVQEAFGPVRSVRPEIVMELAFEGLRRSPRHKSGVATRFPRIVRWRRELRPEDADTLADLLRLLPTTNA